MLASTIQIISIVLLCCAYASQSLSRSSGTRSINMKAAGGSRPSSPLDSWRISLRSMLIPGILTVTSSLASRAAGVSAVTVVGANGRTGRKVVALSLKKGVSTIAVTRGGSFADTDTVANSKKLSTVAADITKLETFGNLKAALKSSSACIFAASASKEGGSPQDVDRDGLIAVAKACIECKVPRLIIISSGAVSKPFSSVYLFLNLFGGIMKAKIEGEDEVRKLYASNEVKEAELSYTIIRPGGLTEDEPRGVSSIELNQGDERSGRISRWDVAAIAIESLNAKEAADVTLECYYADTAQPLANVGISNIFKKTVKDAEGRALTGKERTGTSWEAIFRGLTADTSIAISQ